MIKIAVMSTSTAVKKHFCLQLMDEFSDRDNDVTLLSETSLESPFHDDIDHFDDNALWIYSKQALKELESSLHFDVIIARYSVIEPFLYANSLTLHKDRLACYMDAANQWMETYDTIVWLKNGNVQRDASFGYEYLELLEEQYSRWINDRKERLPISIIDCNSVTSEKQQWLI